MGEDHMQYTEEDKLLDAVRRDVERQEDQADAIRAAKLFEDAHADQVEEQEPQREED